MYPFYVNGSESNLLLQLGRGKSESFTKLYSDYKLSLRTQNFSDNFHNCRLLATEEKGKSKIIYRKIFTVVIGGNVRGLTISYYTIDPTLPSFRTQTPFTRENFLYFYLRRG